MELQLRLALPSHPAMGFDLNCRCYEPHYRDEDKKKRAFDEAFEEEQEAESATDAVPETLPLLLWNNQPNDDGDAPLRLGKNHSPINKNNEDRIVGWPPIKTWRRNHFDQNRGRRPEIRHPVANGRVGGGGGGPNINMYVKVNMEGVGITRKVDLSLHRSYPTLTATLIGMFGKCSGDAGEYKLTYLDREGDWLLAGDVPWRNFMRSVQRLKLLRNYGQQERS